MLLIIYYQSIHQSIYLSVCLSPRHPPAVRRARMSSSLTKDTLLVLQEMLNRTLQKKAASDGGEGLACFPKPCRHSCRCRCRFPHPGGGPLLFASLLPCPLRLCPSFFAFRAITYRSWHINLCGIFSPSSAKRPVLERERALSMTG